MANYCYSTYRIIGEASELDALYELMSRLEKEKEKSLSHGEEEENHPGSRPLESPTAEMGSGSLRKPHPLHILLPAGPFLVRLLPGLCRQPPSYSVLRGLSSECRWGESVQVLQFLITTLILLQQLSTLF